MQLYIADCLNSVFSQSYKNIEVICIDNNSSDNTFEVLNELKQIYPNLIIGTESQAGANAARNNGLKIAKGNWIQFLDADDLLESNKIEHQIGIINKLQIVDIAFIAASWKSKSKEGIIAISNNLLDDVYLAPFISKAGNTCSNLWNSEALQKINGWDCSIKSSQEADLMLRFIYNGFKFVVDKEPHTIVREREFGQISQGHPEQNLLQYIDVRLKYVSLLKKNKNELYVKYSSLYYDFLMVTILSLAKYNHLRAQEIFRTEIKPYWKSSNLYGFNVFKVQIIKCFGINSLTKLLFIK